MAKFERRFRGRLAVLREKHSYRNKVFASRARAEQLEMTRKEVLHALGHFDGLPIRVEHGDETQANIGTVVSAYITQPRGGDPELWCEYRLNDGPEGRVATKLVDHGITPELSLKHAVAGSLCEGHDAIVPVEVSLVIQGARSQCVTKRMVVEASKKNGDLVITPGASQSHPTHGTMATPTDQKQSSPPSEPVADPKQSAGGGEDAMDTTDTTSVPDTSSIDNTMKYLNDLAQQPGVSKEAVQDIMKKLYEGTKARESLEQQNNAKRVAAVKSIASTLTKLYDAMPEKDRASFAPALEKLKATVAATAQQPRQNMEAFVAASAQVTGLVEVATSMIQRVTQAQQDRQHKRQKAEVQASLNADDGYAVDSKMSDLPMYTQFKIEQERARAARQRFGGLSLEEQRVRDSLEKARLSTPSVAASAQASSSSSSSMPKSDQLYQQLMQGMGRAAPLSVVEFPPEKFMWDPNN